PENRPIDKCERLKNRRASSAHRTKNTPGPRRSVFRHRQAKQHLLAVIGNKCPRRYRKQPGSEMEIPNGWTCFYDPVWENLFLIFRSCCPQAALLVWLIRSSRCCTKYVFNKLCFPTAFAHRNNTVVRRKSGIVSWTQPAGGARHHQRLER